MKAQDISNSAQFTSLLEHMPMGVFVLDADFRVAHMNARSASACMGASCNCIGRDYDEVLHSIREQSYAEDTLRILRRTLATGDVTHLRHT